MKIPDGRILIEDAEKNFATLQDMFAYMQKEGLTGYLCVQYGAQKDYILLKNGVVIASLESIGSNFHLIPPARVEERASKGGTILMRGLDEDICTIVEIVLSQKKIYENLKSDFTKLSPFLVTLQKEEGSVVVEISSDTHNGYILIEEGVPSTAFVSSENYYNEGAGALSEILRGIEREIHTITVFKKGEGLLLEG